MGKDVIVACDFARAQQVFSFLDKFNRQEALCEDRHGALLCRGA